MPTLFQGKSKKEREKLFLYGCLPVRAVTYCLVAVLLIKYPRIMGPILVVLSLLGIGFMTYQSYKSPAWWIRWPHILIWVLVGVIGILSYFYSKVSYAIIPVLVIDWIIAVAMYSIRFK